MIVNFIKFARLSGWHEELRGLLLFSSQYDTVFSEDSDDRSILIDVLNGVLDLQQSSVWVKSGGSSIVLVRLL